MLKGLGAKPHEWLRSLNLFSLQRTQGRPHCSYNFIVRGRTGPDLFSVVTVTELREQPEVVSWEV